MLPYSYKEYKEYPSFRDLAIPNKPLKCGKKQL
jgi:hypothetical protein